MGREPWPASRPLGVLPVPAPWPLPAGALNPSLVSSAPAVITSSSSSSHALSMPPLHYTDTMRYALAHHCFRDRYVS